MPFLESSWACVRQIFVFDSMGRLSLSRVKLNTAKNAVIKGRACWVGPDAIQYNGAFEDSKVTIDYSKHFPADDILIYGPDALSGKEASKTIMLIETHNDRRKYPVPLSAARGKAINRAIRAAEIMIERGGSVPELSMLDGFDRSILGIMYILGDHPQISLNERTITKILYQMEFPVPIEHIEVPAHQRRVNRRAVNSIASKIKKEMEYRPPVVKPGDVRLSVYRGGCRLEWRFRPARGSERMCVETVLAANEAGVERINCRITGDCALLVSTRTEELRQRGLIIYEYGEPALTELAYKLLRKLVGKALTKRVGLSQKENNPGDLPGKQEHICLTII